MKKSQINKRNLILLSAFAAVFSFAVFSAAGRDRDVYKTMDAGTLSSIELVDQMADTIDGAATAAVSALDGETPQTVTVSNEENTTLLEKTLFTVTQYETPVTMYTSDTVNVRNGAGKDYDKVGKLKWGTETTVYGETDNGWYEVVYDDATAFIMGDYMVTELPSILKNVRKFNGLRTSCALKLRKSVEKTFDVKEAERTLEGRLHWISGREKVLLRESS